MKVSTRLKIPTSTLRDWVRKRNTPIPRGLKRRAGGGRKPILSGVLEMDLYNWLMNARSKGAPITAGIFLSYAGKSSGLTLTRSWLKGFFHRFGLSLRKSGLIAPLTIVQGTHLEANLEIMWESCDALRNKYSIKNADIINLDEVPVWFDHANNLVIDKVGVDRARVRTNARDKLRVTAILAIRGDGAKLPPLMIFKSLGKYPRIIEKLTKFYAGKIFFATSPKAYSNQDIFMWYLKKIFPDSTTPKLLLMDTSNTHGYVQSQMRVVGPVRSFLKSHNIHVGIIPEHATGLVQPLDTHINKAFKSELKNLWCSYMTENIDRVAPNGLIIDCLPMARYKLIQFVYQAFQSISATKIIKAFKDDGFTLALDGSEEAECYIKTRKF